MLLLVGEDMMQFCATIDADTFMATYARSVFAV